ncbi:MAG: hypothetical protein ACLSE7_07895 [Lachnospirales bacterium]
MKRVFGKVEAVFDLFYLAAGLAIGLWLLRSAGESMARLLAGIMALVLAGGDAFHLIPRVRVILSGREEALRGALGRGKQITSITMTVFYLLLWQIGLLLFAQKPAPVWTGLAFLLAAVRIFLCLMPQNRWQDRYPPISWGIWRNIPFFLLGAETAAAFFLARAGLGGMSSVWLAIVLSFGCYLPVVLWSNRSPGVGMLMLPKTCAYLWILVMCLSIPQ